MDLDEIRLDIDVIDNKLKQLIIERMELSNRVVHAKLETGDTIYKPDREQAVIEGRSAGVDSDIADRYKALLKKIMLVSREYQYGIAARHNGFTIDHSPETETTGSIIVDMSTDDALEDTLRKLKNEAYYVKQLDRTAAEEFRLTTSDRLAGNPSTASILLLIDTAGYCSIIGNILNIADDNNVKPTYIHTGSRGCVIELNARITEDNINSMLLMLLSEYDNIHILGSY